VDFVEKAAVPAGLIYIFRSHQEHVLG
jgi:hypothetical protein